MLAICQPTPLGTFGKLPKELFVAIIDKVLDPTSDDMIWDITPDPVMNLDGTLTSKESEGGYVGYVEITKLLSVSSIWHEHCLRSLLRRASLLFTSNWTFSYFFWNCSYFIPEPGAIVRKLCLNSNYVSQRDTENLAGTAKTLARGRLLPNLQELVIGFENDRVKNGYGESTFLYADNGRTEEFFALIEELKKIRVCKAKVLGLESRQLELEIEECMMGERLGDEGFLELREVEFLA
ncbi:MAG: hypothetical protein LQ340_005806 [Diploschistes diacapsis]|nr:MAG: hypothetical protein LQ340_005806 [Diploschistes diacapsis]